VVAADLLIYWLLHIIVVAMICWLTNNWQIIPFLLNNELSTTMRARS
jgi:hypothetical protein